MDFETYQKKCKETAVYPDVLNGGVFYPALGLAGEVGELLNKIKKIARDNATYTKEELTSELGDVLWYLSEVARQLDINLNDVAEYNLKKLADRMKRNVIHGSGDNR
ncbi:MAG: nucleoside triphosphate pyrophosphohydrolase family protein [Candidatus Rehaiarchaeum fermentans]|nr:nucleoside triphosphate pyrophosphohydrolase family protein [Candidatus Rehaiarchaeum fermentans]MCW1293026.1 nucleoside triphosphate pyrophosphohydrolase family protein [Candidatus Rehaiarchaeum fermentans]MCW1302634.1 nucleoside triphosphate pyrophosphohydrolase family protein [Candidatus Rehaiarchaeum fermentans]